MAVNDNLIRKNPFDFSLSTVITDDSEKREAITKEQERDFRILWDNTIGY